LSGARGGTAPAAGIHLRIVATGFRVAGGLIGIPALLSLLTFGTSLFELGRSAPPGPSENLDIGTYGLVALLADGTEALVRILSFLAGLATWIVVAVAIVSLTTLIVALVLYATGRGIRRHASWARIVAILIAATLLLSSAGSLTVLPEDLALAACLPLGLSLYALWVLFWRFA
jgi:hypothetical protein